VCKHPEAVFFQSQQRSAETGMVRYSRYRELRGSPMLKSLHRNCSMSAANAVRSLPDPHLRYPAGMDGLAF